MQTLQLMVEASYTPNKQTLFESFRIKRLSEPSHGRSRVLGGSLVVMIVLTAVVGGRFHLMQALLCLLGILLFWEAWIAAWLVSNLASRTLKGRPIHFQFTEEGIQGLTIGEEFKIAWNEEMQVVSSSQGLLIKVDRWRNIWLPLNAFVSPEDLQQACAMATAGGAAMRHLKY